MARAGIRRLRPLRRKHCSVRHGVTCHGLAACRRRDGGDGDGDGRGRGDGDGDGMALPSTRCFAGAGLS